MSKVDILRLDSVTTNDTKATTTINTNFQNIQSVIETLLSRTGVTPNYMDAVLDMNSYRIINTAAPTEDFDVVNLKYLRDYVGNLETLVSQATEAAQAAAAQAQNAASSSNIAVSAAQTAIEARDTTINTYLQIQEIKTDVEEIAESIEGIADDPNVIAVGEDLRDPNSSIKGAKEAAESAQASAEAADNSAISANTSADSAENAKDLAVAAASSAQTASNLSQNWAIKTDGPVSDGEYSAKYWAQQASVGVVVDNKSINRNSNDKLQTVGVIDQNNTSTALKEWSGTVQEYTAIQTKDTNTIYNVLEDGVYKGSTQIAAYVSSGGYHPDLLSFQWSDHLLNNVSWLRADTFSWQDGTVYEAAYEHLTDDITGITPTTETVGSNTITVYTATDGHKIVLADQAQTVQDIYDETGVAWYFILDTTNQRFKLPRTKFGFTGLRDTVEKYVEESLPNHKHWLVKNTIGGTNADNISDEYNKPIVKNQNNGNDWSYALGYTDGEANTLLTGAVSENSTYQDNAPVQQRSTQMYLYFYVGDYTQEAIEQTAGLNTELFNGKLDTSIFDETPHIVETYQNGTSWYRIWSDGWCEQGGYIAAPQNSDNNYAVTLLKPFANTNYQIQKTIHGGVGSSTGVEWGWMGDKFATSSPNTTTTLYLSIAGSSYCIGYYWEAKGKSGE